MINPTANQLLRSMGIRHLLFIFVATIVLSSDASAVIVLAFEDFENSGSARSGVEYTSNKAGTASTPINAIGGDTADRYGRFNLAQINASPNEPYNYTNIQGMDFFSVGDQNFDGSASFLTLNWTGINISGFTQIDFSFFLAEDLADDGMGDWDVGDHFWIEAQIDGGGFNRIFAVEDQGAGSTHPRVDTDFDGVGDGTQITADFTEFNTQLLNIGGAGAVLDVRATFNGLTVTDEDLAFDHFRITTVPEPSSFLMMFMGCAIVASNRRRRRGAQSK